MIEAAFPDRRVGFLIRSDSPPDPENFRRQRHFFGGANPVTDLCALSKCDFIAGPPSTFTQWASFWGDVPLYSIDSPTAPISAEDFKVFPENRPVTCDMIAAPDAAK